MLTVYSWNAFSFTKLTFWEFTFKKLTYCMRVDILGVDILTHFVHHANILWWFILCAAKDTPCKIPMHAWKWVQTTVASYYSNTESLDQCTVYPEVSLQLLNHSRHQVEIVWKVTSAITCSLACYTNKYRLWSHHSHSWCHIPCCWQHLPCYNIRNFCDVWIFQIAPLPAF